MPGMDFIDRMPAALWQEQVRSGGLVPDYTGPEIWDCTDERPLVDPHVQRRIHAFGDDWASFALAGGREGFAVVDFAALAALDGPKALRRKLAFYERRGASDPFLAHSTGLADNARFGTGAGYSNSTTNDLRQLYDFFRHSGAASDVDEDEWNIKRGILTARMLEMDAAVLNTHSDTHHETSLSSITADGPELVGCAHNKLVGAIALAASQDSLLAAAEKIGNLMSRVALPFDAAAKGLRLVADEVNGGSSESFCVRRSMLVAEHVKRSTPPDVVLAGEHVAAARTYLVVDGGRTARNTTFQAANGTQSFLSNPVRAAHRLQEISEYGEDPRLTTAIAILHALAVRNALCGDNPIDDPGILPIYVSPQQHELVF